MTRRPSAAAMAAGGLNVQAAAGMRRDDVLAAATSGELIWSTQAYPGTVADGWLGLDWGNVPAWVGSVLTGSSLLIAALSYRRSVAERTREQAERERAQATKVSTWVVNSRQAQVHNGNDVAVLIQAFFAESALQAASDQVSLAPGQTRVLRLPQEYERLAERSGRQALIPSLLIVDSAGRSWLRDAQGGLMMLTASDRTSLATRLSGASIQLDLAVRTDDR